MISLSLFFKANLRAVRRSRRERAPRGAPKGKESKTSSICYKTEKRKPYPTPPQGPMPIGREGNHNPWGTATPLAGFRYPRWAPPGVTPREWHLSCPLGAPLPLGLGGGEVSRLLNSRLGPGSRKAAPTWGVASPAGAPLAGLQPDPVGRLDVLLRHGFGRHRLRPAPGRFLQLQPRSHPGTGPSGEQGFRRAIPEEERETGRPRKRNRPQKKKKRPLLAASRPRLLRGRAGRLVLPGALGSDVTPTAGGEREREKVWRGVARDVQ